MLSSWQRSLHCDGFATLGNGLREDAVADLLEEFSHLSRKAGQAGIRHVLKYASVANVAFDPQCLGVAKQVLGPEAFPFRATFFDKSPERNWLIAWHQDTALPMRERREQAGWGPWSIKDGVIYAHAPASALTHVLALRIHLDDSTFLNGPLRIVPGTHKAGVLSDDEIHRLSTRISAVTCTVRKSGILAMRPLAIHASSKSQDDLPRRVLHIEYAARPDFEGEMHLAQA